MSAPEFLVNDSTSGFQVTYAETRNVAGNASGDYVVAFAGEGPGDTQGIFARRFDANNTPQGGQFLVNETTDGNQRYPSVAVGAGGESVVVWSGKGIGDNDGGVFVRLIDNTGALVGGEIKVSETIPSDQHRPVVAKAPDGSFIVTWSGKGVGDLGDSGVFARRFASDGTPLTGEFLVNTTSAGSQRQPDVAVGSDGRFVISWNGVGPGDVEGVFFQRFNPTAGTVGSETRVNTTINGQQHLPSVGLSDANDFVITWSGFGEVAGNEDVRGIFLQRYDSAGSPVGGETLVNTTTALDQADASISRAPNGEFVVTWTGLLADASTRIYAQRYDAAGGKSGSEFPVSTNPTADQEFSSVATFGNQGFAVVWSGSGLGDTNGVFAATFPTPFPASGLVIDNGDPGFADSGGWTDVPGFGFDADALVSVNSVVGLQQASWTFDCLTPGQFDVSLTWLFGNDRADNVPVVIRDGIAGPVLATLSVNQLVAPVGPLVGGRPFEVLDRVTITGSELVVELSNQGTSGAVIADAVLIQSFTPPPNTPEITVRKDGGNVADGSNFSLSTVTVGDPGINNFEVRNDGSADLVIQPISVAGSVFSVGTNFAPNTIVPPGGQAPFSINVDTSAAGIFNGSLSFNNNDGDEDPFDLSLAVNILGPGAPSALIDDGDPDFSLTGGWTNVPNFGFQNDAKIITSNSTGTATWTFTGLAAGDYNVSTTWLSGNDRATNAPYVVRDGVAGPILATVPVDQTNAPVGPTMGGRPFMSFGTHTLTGDTLVVEVDNIGADGHVVADAVFIELVTPAPNTPEIAVSRGALTVLDGGSVSFGSANQGDPALSETLTVENVGTADIILQPLSLTGSGFSLTSPNFTAGQVLAPAAQVAFTVELSTATVGTFNGSVSFANNDADENPFNFDIDGNINTPPPAGVQIIDDGDPGFSSAGNFTPVSGFGFDNDALAGNGINGVETAAWQFDSLTPGSSHDVSVTWLPGSDREAAVTYVIRDGVGGAVVGTKVVDQTQAPVGIIAGGRPFQSLGTFTTTTGTLVVELSTAGTTLAVIADAVRIEMQ